MLEAVGHGAKIWKFSENTVMVPLGKRELEVLSSLLQSRMALLQKSKDYPEHAVDCDLLDNILTALHIAGK